jgi:adenylate cyclase
MHRLLLNVGLRFPDAKDEQSFLHEYCLRLRPQIQLAFVLGGFIYYAFFVWDRMIDPLHAELTHGVRAALAMVIFSVAVGLFSERLQRHLELIQTLMLSMATIGLAAIYSILDNGFAYGGVGVVLVVLFNLAMLRTRLPYFAAFCAISWTSYVLAQVLTGHTNLWLVVTNNMVIGSAVFISLFSVTVRERDMRKQFLLERELVASRQLVEEMIYSMLPSQIVKRMTAGETVIADSYGEVSIVFADLVAFTELTRQVSPGHLVEILNKLFSRFDDLAATHRIEKIKTIGDAYMAVSGMDKGDAQHAERAVEFAFGMLRSVDELSRETGIALTIRVGLHVGPIIAGVIGSRKPAFDCWGDSVNIASRLESSGLAGGIQISEAARWRLKGKYHIVENIAIDIKGIGQTKTYTIYPPERALALQGEVLQA